MSIHQQCRILPPVALSVLVILMAVGMLGGGPTSVGSRSVPRLRASVRRMSASAAAAARRLKPGGAMLIITGNQGIGVDCGG